MYRCALAAGVLLVSGLAACGNPVVPTSKTSTPSLACSSSTAPVGRPEPAEAVVAVSGMPFSVLPIPGTDRAIASVTVGRPPGGELDVLQVRAASASLVSSKALPGASGATGMVLSHNGRWLAVTTFYNGTFLVSVADLLAGTADPVVGQLEDGTSGQIEAAFSIDDRYLFVADENSAQLSVFDVERAFGSGFTSAHVAVGQVPLGPSPVGIAVSPDGRWVYVTTEGGNGESGSLWLLDEHTATQHPAAAVVGHVGAGCDTVRVVLSPHGDVAWVTARASDVLIGFATAELITQPSRALRAVVRVGPEPVGLALYDGGRYAVVANSARFVTPNEPQSLTVVDLEAALAGRGAVVAWIAAGAFPREVATDGGLGLVTNYDSNTVEAFRLPT